MTSLALAAGLHLAAIATFEWYWPKPHQPPAWSAPASFEVDLLAPPAPSSAPPPEEPIPSLPPSPISATTPAPEPQPPLEPDPDPDPDPDPEPEPEPEPLTTTESAPTPLPPAPERPAPSAAEILASRDLAIASLQGRDQPGIAPPGTRRRTIDASTKDVLYAHYLEAWRRKVERIGNLNYPQEARDRQLFGSLVLHVAVRADGSLEQVRVLRPSGHAALDQAALRIVELAAPFAPFPPAMRAEMDAIDIVRTWQFTRQHRLGWGN